MRKSLWVIPLLFVAAFARPARADTFSITLFDGNTTQVDGMGTFTFDGTTFTAFTVTWNGLTFNLAPSANGAGHSFGCASGGASASFIMLTTTSCQGGWLGAASAPPNFNILELMPANQVGGILGGVVGTGLLTSGEQVGSFSVTDISTPEPSSVGLMLVGIGVLVGARKRWASGHQPAR